MDRPAAAYREIPTTVISASEEEDKREPAAARMMIPVGPSSETTTAAARSRRRFLCCSHALQATAAFVAVAVLVATVVLVGNDGSSSSSGSSSGPKAWESEPDLVTASWPGGNSSSGTAWHAGSTAAASHKLGYLRFDAPSPSLDPGDLLVWFLTRSGGNAPLWIDGWTRVAECFKSYDRQARCLTVPDDCVAYSSDDGRYCTEFADGERGNDLLTVVYARWVVAVADDPNNNNVTSSYAVTLPAARRAKTGILTAVRGADLAAPAAAAVVNGTDDPPDLGAAAVVRGVATTSCDGDRRSVFPSVDGAKAGDILLLSMAADDPWPAQDFAAPDTAASLAFLSAADKTAALYGKQLTADGPTGALVTNGPGGTSDNRNPADCKDLLIAIVLRGR